MHKCDNQQTAISTLKRRVFTAHFYLQIAVRGYQMYAFRLINVKSGSQFTYVQMNVIYHFKAERRLHMLE